MATRKFILTGLHLKLLRRSNIQWNEAETGAPGLDPKRPYGNSDVARDIAEIAGLNLKDYENYLPEDLERRLLDLHKETQTALQIVLVRGSFTPGEYANEGYGSHGWHLVRRLPASFLPKKFEFE